MRSALGLAVSVGFVVLASAALAQESSRWTGFYAGGDIGGTSNDLSGGTSAAPCHVGCGTGATTVGGHAGYDAQSRSGLVGGIEGDVGGSSR